MRACAIKVLDWEYGEVSSMGTMGARDGLGGLAEKFPMPGSRCAGGLRAMEEPSGASTSANDSDFVRRRRWARSSAPLSMGKVTWAGGDRAPMRLAFRP